MSRVQTSTAHLQTASQRVLKEQARALLQQGLEGHVVESERLVTAISAVPLDQLDHDGAAAVIYIGRLLLYGYRAWESLRLLTHFGPAIHALGDQQMKFTLALRKARAHVITGDGAGALLHLAEALPEISPQTLASTVCELWTVASAAWTALGVSSAALYAARKVLKLEQRPAHGDGYQTVAAYMLVDAHLAMGNRDLAIEEGMRLARVHTAVPPSSADTACRYAHLYLGLMRALVEAGRLLEANEVLAMSKLCTRPEWPTAESLVALVVATCAGAVGDTEKVDEITAPLIHGPGVEDAIRARGLRVLTDARGENATRAAMLKNTVAERRALREQRTEQLAAQVQWDIDSGAYERRKALMSPSRAQSWVLDNVAAGVGLRKDPSGAHMALAGTVAAAMARAAPELGLTLESAEVAARLALVGYIFVPSSLMFKSSGGARDLARVAMSYLASQGGAELLSAFDVQVLRDAAQAARALRLRTGARGVIAITTVPNAPPLAKMVAVALAAAESINDGEVDEVMAPALRRAVKQATPWLDPSMVKIFMDMSDAELEQAGRFGASISPVARAHQALLSAVIEQ